jgi:hypothetical protein
MSIEKEHRSEATRNPWIGLGAGLLGVVVGGAFSLGATWLTLDNQTQREQEAQHRLAVGTARVMIATFDNATRRLCTVGKTGTFLPITPPLSPQVPPSDRIVLAGELDTQEAVKVGEGEHAMATWQHLYGDIRQRVDAGKPFNPYKGLHISVHRAMDAREALEDVADDPGNGRQRCDTSTFKKVS